MENSQYSPHRFPRPMQNENYPSYPNSFPNFSVPPPPIYPSGLVPQNYTHSISGPYPTIPNFPLHESLASDQFGYSSGHNTSELKPKDALWVEHFLSSIGKSSCNSTKSCTRTTDTMNISEAQECVGSSVSIVKELKELEVYLTHNVSTLSLDEWQTKLTVIQSKKCQLIASLNKFTNPVIDNLKFALKKRAKKRSAQKCRRAIDKKANIDAQSRRQQLHCSIDTWLEKMQLSVEKVKSEESLKRQADLVLADVTQKKVEARRNMALLSALLKLRQLRVQTASSRGESVSSEQAKIFDSVSDHLQVLWSDQMNGYNLEEKGLRVMLEEETQEHKKDVPKSQKYFAEWWRLLFGSHSTLDNPYTIAERNMDAFIAARQDWDKFVAPDAVPMASAIPVGWVLPCKPSTKEWETLLAGYLP